MTLNTYFKSALTYDDYLQLLGDNLALYELHYKKFTLDDEKIDEIKKLGVYRILMITEPWCGDSLALLPVVRKICEQRPDWELRIILRDANPDLMDQHLTNGVRAIPIFLFLGPGADPVFKWGPRPEVAQRIFEDHRELIVSKKMQKTDVIKKIRTFYAKDRGVAASEELIQQLSLINKNHS